MKIMGRWVACSAFCLALALAAAEPSIAQISNSWINFGQPYYKIRIADDGIYRLTYSDLQSAGVPVGSLDPRRFNIYHRGVEQAINVTGQEDAVFDPADVIEFFGKRNDGTLDKDLYQTPEQQPHPHYNLFSDTTSYFLTWNPLPVPGKRMENFFEVNSPVLPAEQAHYHRRLDLFANEFSFVEELQSTKFTTGEAWTGTTICTVSSGCTGQQDFLIDNLIGPVPAFDTPSLKVLLTGRGTMTHSVEVYAGPNSGSIRLLGATGFLSFETTEFTAPLAWTDIGSDGKMTVRIRIVPSAERDLVSVSFIEVTMPQDYDARLADGKVFNVAPSAGGRAWLEMKNTVPGARVFDITEADQVRIIGTTPAGAGLNAIVNQVTQGRTLYLTNTARPVTLQRITFRSISPSLHNYIIISHKSLMKPALGYPNAVEAFAGYRASAAGGGYDTLVVTMDQLYDQFNYGETSPRAIFQFMKYLDAGGDPRFLFLIGKGLEVSYGYHRKTSHAPGDFHDLVPSAGIPGSDMIYTAGLSGTTHEPGVPTGRLTASTADQVAAYLNKVMEAEALPFEDLWRKDLLHLSGGIQPGEPALFRSFVDGFKAIAEDYYLGGQVETISKQTLNVELINVKDEVNKGLNLITFYGHSGPGTIDIDIGYVSDPSLGYQNAGKYPGFLINGCNAGRFFDNRVTFGEDWMLTPNKGAKSFIAHSSFGLVNPLRQYSELFYQVAFGDSTYLHKGVGEVQKEVARRYLTIYGSSIVSVTQVQQMVLLGDPAVSLFGTNKPDYEISSGAVSVQSFDGSPVTAQSDSFAIEFRVRNFGRAHPEPLNVRVVRTLFDGSVKVYDSIYSPVFYQETLRMIIRKGVGNTEFGNNAFRVMLDPDQDTDELKETNNESEIDYFIPVNGSRNLFPPDFSIVPASTTELVFQHTDLTLGERSFVVEVDTAATFNSPYLGRTTVYGKGLARQPLTLLPADSLVYYWRTRLDNPLPGESADWTTSSFAHIANSPQGWAQLKFPQLQINDTLGVTWNEATRRLEFLSSMSTVDVETYGSANPNAPSEVSVKINGDEWNISTQGVPCRNNTLNLMAFDKSSSAPYAGIPFGHFDPRTCGRQPQMINSFTPAEMDLATDGIAAWVSNIQPSDSVIIFSIGDAGYSSWSLNTRQQLEQLGIGVSQLDVLEPGEPFVVLGRKGSAGGEASLIRPTGSPANEQSLSVNTSITGRYSSGSLRSTLVGPAEQWGTLTARIAEATANDSLSFEVIGVSLSGQETMLKELTDGTHNISDIDAADYPNLRLVYHILDSIDLTAVQLRKWLVTYTPTAEGMLMFTGTLGTEVVEEGATWTGAYGFVNISGRAFPDSLTVRTDVFTRTEKSLDRKEFRIKAPAPGDTTSFEIMVGTTGKAGLNDVTVFVNPRILPEQYYDNNILPLYARLDVVPDETGPVLDVTIDGRRVVNGDVVSSSPVILARVIDRNPFLLKTDTVGFNFYLQFPCDDPAGCGFQRINFTDPLLSWSPATVTEDFKVEYRPQDLMPGDYLLRMEATDVKGNASGKEPYELLFTVSDEDAFIVRSVYPNPSPDVFYFQVFIGGNIPDDFRLDLFSATGTPIQNFGMQSIPMLHVGTNDFQIGAVDASGGLLPAGVYIYRFTVVVGEKMVVASGRLVVTR